MAAGKFTTELFEDICNEIAYSDKGLVTICKAKGLNANSFYEWLAKDKDLGDKYARARELQAEFLADQILEIADDKSGDEVAVFNGDEGGPDATRVDYENIQRSKLRVDARKWKAAKLSPKKYGDKVDLTSNGKTILAPDWLTDKPDGSTV